MINLQLIDKGQYYKELSRSNVIFICPFDVFEKGRHIYEYMTLLMREQENIEKGKAQGIQGMVSTLALVYELLKIKPGKPLSMRLPRLC